MQVNKWLKLNKYQQLSVIILGVILTNTNNVQAQNLDAGFVLNKMNADQQVSYIAGVVEGMAYSRYLRDKPSEDGMNCIYQWYANNTGSGEKSKNVDALFSRHPDKPVGVLLYVLMKKECGA